MAVIAFLFAASSSAPARAATAYMLDFTQFSPYQRSTVAGPFPTLSECLTVKAQQPYVAGGVYSCDMIGF